MGKNYDIKINPEEPSRQVIERHMDFDAVLKQYQSAQHKGSRARIVSLLYIAVAAAAATGMFFLAFHFINAGSTPPDAVAYFAAQPYVNPPLAQIQPTFEHKKINVNQGGVYEYESGSRLVVPAAAFMNDRGQLVEGEVDILYRELNDYVDFFLSGIPMTYDSAGNKLYLESAGMVEIYAEQNGKRLQMAPGKELKIELISYVQMPMGSSLPQYFVYSLDQPSRNWVYQGVNQMELLDEELSGKEDPYYNIQLQWYQQEKALEATYANDLASLEASIPMPVAPAKPQIRQNDQPTIELDVADENFEVEGVPGSQEEWIRKYRGAIWQISAKSPAYDERAFQVTWESMHLKALNPWEYALTLENGARHLDLIVNPVLVGSAYDEAIKEYEAANARYQSSITERESQLKARREALQQQMTAAKTNLQQQLIAQLSAAGAPAQIPNILVRRKVLSRFTANSLGIWNCDNPHALEAMPLKARFIDQQGKKIQPCTAYITSKGHNAVYRFLAADNAEVQLPLNKDNLVWLVTNDNKLAICQPDQIRVSNEGEDNYTFVMNVVNRALLSEEEIRQILHF